MVQSVLIVILSSLGFVFVAVLGVIVLRRRCSADADNYLHLVLWSHQKKRSSSEIASTFEMNEIFGSPDQEDRSIKAINVIPLIENTELNVAHDYFIQRRLDRVSFSKEGMIKLVEVEPVANVYEPNRDSVSL